MVVDPDQRDLPAGALHFILSLRATGDGSISSIVFRTGVIHADHQIEVMAATTCIVEPSQIPRPTYKKAILEQKLLELGLTHAYTRSVAEELGESFTVEERASMIETELQEDPTKEGERDRQDSARRLLMLVKSHYSLSSCPNRVYPRVFSQSLLGKETGSKTHLCAFSERRPDLHLPRGS